MKRVAFIGTGNMGSALARAACRAVGADQVILADHAYDKAQSLAQALGCQAVPDNEQAIREAQYIFLCVKPQILPGVAAAIAPLLEECRQAGAEKVLVSIAAGVTLDSLGSWLAQGSYTAPKAMRLMPNTCVAIGQGMMALAVPAGMDPAHVKAVEEILSKAGRVERIAEGLMDAYTAVAGCGPAYVYPFIEALADGGVMAGLPRAQAMIYAAQTVLGAAAMVLETGEHPGQLKDAVCSPGGSTIAGVAALERAGFRAAAIDAVLAACQRNQELGKTK